MRRLRTLGLPLSDARGAWITTALVFAIDLATMAKDLTLYDSPELALVAHQLGLGHPIGQPLHTWLGFVFAHLPGIAPLVGLGAMSALFGALSIVPAWALAERLAPTSRAWLVGPVLALAALHPLAWEPASRVEVYTLASFLALWAVARASAESSRPWGVGLALGLAASAHAVIAAAHGLALLPRVVRLARERPLRELGLFVGAGFAGLIPFVHLAIAGRDPRRFAWGAPTDGASLFAYLSGADYAHNAGIDASTFVEHLAALARWSALEATLPIALLGLVAHLTLGRRVPGLRWALPIAAALSLAFVARNVVFHVDVPDYRGYLLAPWMSAGAGVAALASSLAARGGRFRVYGGALAVLVAAALLVSPSHLTRARDTPSLGRALVEGALAEAPPNAIMLVEADHWVAPLLYAQQVEGMRSDVVVLAHGLASSSWYWEHLYARHPLEPFALRGPGGRDARIQRFLAANASRPVVAETWSLAQRAGRVPCGVGWMVFTGTECDAAPSSATEHLARFRPSSDEALESVARVGFARGEALAHLGRPRAAYAAFLAGVEASFPAESRPPPAIELPVDSPPLAPVWPAWARSAAIHDPARNVFAAAMLARAFQQADAARSLHALANAMGLPEAQPDAR